MSIAISNWKNKDARKEIHALVDRVQEIGFSISKDFIFKTYLYLYSKDIRFKVTNFSSENAHNFEQDWEKIRDTIISCFELIRGFGYTDFSLTSKNAVIPIIYFLYHKNIYPDYPVTTRFKEDRETVKKWLHIMTLKRVFGSHSDNLLSQIRKAFTSDVTSEDKIKPNTPSFPADALNDQIKGDISVGDDFLEELLITQKDDRYAFSILALLYPRLDYRNNDFHKDHLHPISGFTKIMSQNLAIPLADQGIFFSREWNNSIINLQMLDSNENMSKQDKSLAEWFDQETTKQDPHLLRQRCIIPNEVSLEFKDFVVFAKNRKIELKKRLKAILG